METDKIASFEDIILNPPVLPSTWKIISWQNEEKLVLEEIIFDEEGKPKLGYSLTILESLAFNLVKGETKLPASRVKHICKFERIERFSDVSNILAFLRSDLNLKENQKDQLKLCVSNLSTFIEAQDEASDEYKKLLFLRDQLALINKTHRRYCSSFVWTALTWFKTSPALYRLIQKDGLLTLPSIRYLKQISSSFSLETGLSTGVCSYLKTRISALSQEERTVVLMIDEVILCKNKILCLISFFV